MSRFSDLNYAQLGQIPVRRRPAAMAAPGGESPGPDAPAPATRPTSPQSTIRRFEIDLTNARSIGGAIGPQVIDIDASVIWCAKASDGAMCDIQIDGNDPVPFGLHYNVQGVPFRRLQITNAAQAGKALTLIVIDDPAGLVEVQ